jgi:hypothetical protein
MKIFRTIIITVLALLMQACVVDQHSVNIDDFFKRREICEHLRGEFPDPPNPERVQKIIEGIEKYCTGTDAQLAALKIRYADNPAIMERLNAYEPRIESK